MTASPEPPSRLFYETQPKWLDEVRAWAASVPEVERVWIFGSRATGVRTLKVSPSAVPDLDIAYILTGCEPGEALAQAIIEGAGWRQHLQATIPVPIDLQVAQADDGIVWPAVEAHGVLIYERAGAYPATNGDHSVLG